MAGFLVALLLPGLGAAAPGVVHPGAAPSEVAPLPHPFRVSVADAAIVEEGLEIRIRFFWDDLQLAMMEYASDMEFRLAETARVDARIERYINEMLTIQAAGTALQGTVVARGVEGARRPDEVMWWYTLRYRLDPATERISVRNRLLFNLFEDQRNLFHLRTRSGSERSWFFSWDEDSATMAVG